MAMHFTAAPVNKGYVPAFSVERLEGEYEAVEARRDAKAKGIETEKVMRKRGFLVTFPRGHSIHVPTMDELKRLGFDRTTVPLVDDEGDEVGSVPNVIRTRKGVKEDA